MIVLVCPFIFERVESIAEAIYEASGSKPHVVTLSPPTNDESIRCFETVNVAISEQLAQKVQSLSPHIVHNITKYIDITTLELLKANIRFHYDYKDIFFGFVNHSDPQLDMHKQIWLAMLQRNIPISYRDGRALIASRRLGYNNPVGYYLPEFITSQQHQQLGSISEPYVGKNRKEDIVFIGNFSLETLNPEQAGTGQIAIAECVTTQELNYTIYPKQTSGRCKEDFRDYYRLSETRINFRYMETLNRDALHRVLPNYGWGSLLMPYCHFPALADKIFFPTPQYGIPGRVSDYLGAGLPLLVSQTLMPELIDWIDLYGIGISIKGDEIRKIEHIVNSVNYHRLRSNVSEFVTKFLTPQHCGEILIQAYDRHN